MTATSNQEMHRSISMPAKPKHLEIKVLQRSEEKETICPQDYYPESPLLGRSKHPNVSSMSHNADDSSESISKSANNFILYSDDWAGSTIELNADLRRNEIDICPRKRPPYRVIEKNGRENILFRRIPEKSWRYIRDFVTTLVRPLLRHFPQKQINPNASNPTSLLANENITNVAAEAAPTTTERQELPH